MPISGKKQPLCWQCKQPHSDSKFSHEQNLIIMDNNKIIATSREFIGVCPTHGKQYAKTMGRHSSITEKKLKSAFWKHRAYLKSHLTKSEYDVFYEAMHGRASPKGAQLARWMKLINSR
jgi:hypothetical protein